MNWSLQRSKEPRHFSSEGGSTVSTWGFLSKSLPFSFYLFLYYSLEHWFFLFLHDLIMFNTQLFLRHYILQDFHFKSQFIPFSNIEVSITLLPWFYKIWFTTLGTYSHHWSQGTDSSPNRLVTRLKLSFNPPRYCLKPLFFHCTKYHSIRWKK